MKNGKQAMVLFSLSVAGMNQGLMVSSRRPQRAGAENPGEEDVEHRRGRGARASVEREQEKKCCSCCSKCCCACKPLQADTIDVYARAVFPATFAIVNVIYWVAYTM